jgi:hypothetical protein
MTKGSLAILLLVGVLTVTAGLAGGALLWWWTKPPAPAPTPSPAPATTMGAAPTPTPEIANEAAETPQESSPEPSPEATPEPGAPTPRPRATATPPPSPRARDSAAPSGPAVSALLVEADSAVAAGAYDKAAALYGRAAELEPRNAASREGRARAASIAASLARSFVPGQTTVLGAGAKTSGLALFEADGVDVKATGRIPGTLYFGVSPAHVKPGDAYSVRVLLQNDGKKTIEVSGLTLVETVGTEHIETPLAPRARKVRSGSRELLGEHRGAWRDGVAQWSLEATVRSKAGDTYTSQLVWH